MAPSGVAPCKSRDKAGVLQQPGKLAGSSEHTATMTDSANKHTEQPGLQSLSKSFEPAALEAHWGPEWEQRGYGVAGYRGTQAPQAGQPSFAIQLPPPNVTGTLHMGHAVNQTIMDSLPCYHRRAGFNTA